MAVTANVVPDHVELIPNVASTLTLRLYSDDAEPRQVALSASGEFGKHVQLQSATATIETNQIVDLVVTALAPSTVQSGTYSVSFEVAPVANQHDRPPEDGAGVPATPLATATATAVVATHSDYTIEVHPARSRGSKQGRHAVRVVNIGNVDITLGVVAENDRDDVAVEIGPDPLTVAPGEAGALPVRVTPATTWWSGPTHDHDFTLHATSTDGRADELTATFQQRPRVPSWLGPAAVGASAALLLGTIAWFALLRPWVQDTADNAAAEAIEQDRAALRERIDELEAAAAEAAEFPLGTPFDVRLEADPSADSSEQSTAIVEAGTIVSITDVIFQNPTGAVGTVSLQRGDEVILESELANFRDFDLHFVAPYQFGDDTEIVLSVECRTPGNGESTCPVAVSLVGFVDEVG